MFAETLKTHRKAKGLSQEELAIRLNVVRQTISKWEKGLSVPDADLLIRMADIFEVSVSELLGDTAEIEIEPNAVAEQLSRINEQLAIINRRSRRIWKIAAIAFGAAVLTVGIILIVNYSTKLALDRNNMSSASGYGMSAEQAEALYDIQRAEYIREQLRQTSKIQDAIVVIRSEEQNPFRVKDDEDTTTASVQVFISDSDTLTKEEVQAIIDLVKSTVPDVEYKNIAIVDQRYNPYIIEDEN